MGKNKALINYYARLVKRGTYTMDMVQEDLRDEVAKVVESLPEPEFDPVTQTPADYGDNPHNIRKEDVGLGSIM